MPEPRQTMTTRPALRSAGASASLALALLLGPMIPTASAADELDWSRPAPVPTRTGEVKGEGEAPVPEATGHVIVRYRPGASAADRDRARAGAGLRLVERVGRRGDLELLEPVAGPAAQALARIGNHPAVLLAEAEHRVQLAGGPVGEPSFGQQWALHNTGQTVNGYAGVPDVDMNVPEAWDVTTGDGALVIAVTDSGVDLDHPDLAGRIWTNPGETAGDGLDNDGNGLIDDVNGWNFCDETNVVDAGTHSHGTHVAGSIAAGANGIGIAGVAPSVQIMPIKFINDSEDACATETNAIQAIDYAVSMGAHIINASWGGYASSPALEAEIASATETLVVAAAGNNNRDNDGSMPLYPASFDLPNILAVASIHNEGHLTASTNYGLTSVDVAAPGEDILSTVPGGGLALSTGTSMAAANTTGVAALAASAFPDLVTDPAALRAHLIGTARALPTALGWIASPRLVDARAAVVDRPDVVRLSGANRYATAAEISQATYIPHVPFLFVATGQDFPDALAGGAIAAQLGVPLLLVRQNALPTETKAEIQRLQPLEIFVLGSSGVVSNAVLAALDNLVPGPATRIAGANRYATAAQVSLGWSPGVPNVFVATGLDYPDALSAVPASGALGGPLLLTAKDTLPTATKAELERLDPARVVILGSSGVVSNTVASEIAFAAGAPVVRWAGANRYATAAAVSANAFPAAETAFIASGLNFPDALAGGPPGGAYGGPLLLATTTNLPSPSASDLVRLQPARVFILGGPTVVSDSVIAQVEGLFP